jgi:uncharacterized protein YuzE
MRETSRIGPPLLAQDAYHRKYGGSRVRHKAQHMKLHYDPDTDSLYIDLNARPGADAQEVVDGLVIDLDDEGRPVGIDIQHASRELDLSTLETQALPVHSVKLLL